VTSTAHVTESSLAGTVGTTSSNTGDTRYSTTGTPRFGTGLVTCSLADRVRLSAILGNFVVNEANNVWSDGSLENSWQADCRLGAVALLLDDRNEGTSS